MKQARERMGVDTHFDEKETFFSQPGFLFGLIEFQFLWLFGEQSDSSIHKSNKRSIASYQECYPHNHKKRPDRYREFYADCCQAFWF